MTDIWDALDDGATDTTEDHVGPLHFKRSATGAPWINHPTKLTKAGKPARVMTSRPSSLYKTIEDRWALEKWIQRKVVHGLAIMVDRGFDITEYAGIDPDDGEDRKRLDGVVSDALDAAEYMLAAARGTHAHEITEDIDNDIDPVHRLEQGYDLGLPEWLQLAIPVAWRRLVDAYGLEILAVELPIVSDRWGAAGTLDRVARLTRSLWFGDVLIPAGTVVILDIKTGRLRFGRDGLPEFWHGYAVQIAAYADSKPYLFHPDGTEERGEWEQAPSTEHGLIAHIDVREALDTGILTSRLLYVDLRAGAEAADLAIAAKDYSKRRDVFALDSEVVAVAAHEVTS